MLSASTLSAGTWGLSVGLTGEKHNKLKVTQTHLSHGGCRRNDFMTDSINLGECSGRGPQNEAGTLPIQ